MKSDPYKNRLFNFVVRGSSFTLFCYVAHLSGLNWAVFAMGGFWGVFAVAYPGCLDWN
jgi:hypothetical protein